MAGLAGDLIRLGLGGVDGVFFPLTSPSTLVYVPKCHFRGGVLDVPRVQAHSRKDTCALPGKRHALGVLGGVVSRPPTAALGTSLQEQQGGEARVICKTWAWGKAWGCRGGRGVAVLLTSHFLGDWMMSSSPSCPGERQKPILQAPPQQAALLFEARCTLYLYPTRYWEEAILKGSTRCSLVSLRWWLCWWLCCSLFALCSWLLAQLGAGVESLCPRAHCPPS